MKHSDIRKDKDGNWKPRTSLNPSEKSLKRTALSKLGKRGKKLKKADATTKKALILERGDVCEMAGTSECLGRIEAHHVRTKAAHPELRHDPENLKLLCLKHHSEIHGGQWLP